MRDALQEWFGRNRAGLALGLLVMLVGGLVGIFLQRPASAPVVVSAPTARPSPSPANVVPIAVHVSGEVARPGLYSLPVGSRVDDAVRTAGGASDQADLERLNLAARLADGQQVAVPRKAEPRESGSADLVATPRINVNRAGVAELDRLPGVGPVTAQRIVAYREQHGPFTRIEQLREAKLVNQNTWEKIKDSITISSLSHDWARADLLQR